MTGNDSASGRDHAVAVRGDVSVGVVVADAFTSRAPALGLGSALPLGGGDRASLRRMSQDLGFEWQPALRSVLDAAMARAHNTETRWFSMPPLLLLGHAGVGRTHLARRIAQLSGRPHVLIDLADPAGAEQLCPSARGPDLLLPSLPVLAMAASGCANPIVSVTGVASASVPVQQVLAGMVEPSSAARWRDSATGAFVDLRHVNWMIQCDEESDLTRELQAVLHPVELVPVGDHGRWLHVIEVLAEAAIDLGVIDQVQARIGDGLQAIGRPKLGGFRHGGRSTSEIYASAQSWLRANCT